MKSQTGGNGQDNNKINFVRSHNDILMQYPLDCNSNSIAKVTSTPSAAGASTASNNADLLMKKLEEQLILEKLAASAAGSLNFESPIPLSPPLSPDCTSQLMTALSYEPGLTFMHNTHSEDDDNDDIILKELKKNMILNQLLSVTAVPELATSSRISDSISRACSMGGVNQSSFLSSRAPRPANQRSSYPSINNNNISLAVAERLLHNSCFNQKVGADTLLTAYQNEFDLLPSFTSRDAATLCAETAAARRTTFPSRNLAFAPSSNSQMRWKLNEFENNHPKNEFLPFDHDQQIKRNTHSHLMSAAFNNLMERQRMLETCEHDSIGIHRN